MDRRRFRELGAAGLTGLAAGAVVLPQLPFPAERLAALVPLRCPLHFWTGIECPTCGLGRGLIAALAGNFEASSGYHVLATPLLFALVLALITAVVAPGLVVRADRS